AAQTQSQSQNCALPNQSAIMAIDQRLAAAGTVVGPDFCGKVDNYACYRRVFSPTGTEGQSVESECAKGEERGGDVWLKLDSRNYSTYEASRLPDTSSSALRPGGEFNRSEYVCHQKELKDGENVLAIGEGSSLGEALSASYALCVSYAPRLGSGTN